MIATLWLISILSTTMTRGIECMYEMPLLMNSAVRQPHNHRTLDNELVEPSSDLSSSRFEIAQQEKRTLPSLSISNSLDVLRQRLLLEIARRQMREMTNQVEMNREHLTRVGKRQHDLSLQDPQNLFNVLPQPPRSNSPPREQQQTQPDNNLSLETPDDVEAALHEKLRNALQYYRV